MKKKVNKKEGMVLNMTFVQAGKGFKYSFAEESKESSKIITSIP